MKTGVGRLNRRGTAVRFGTLACLLLLAGCGGSSEAINRFTTSGQGPIEVDASAFASPVYCPPMRMQGNTSFIRKYERGKDNDPSALIYQLTIEDWARSCTGEGASDTRINVGVSGDVTPGPAWKGGEVVVPLRVVVLSETEGEDPYYSEMFNIPVTIGEGAPAETWAMIDNKFVVPRNVAADIRFGFDERGRGRR